MLGAGCPAYSQNIGLRLPSLRPRMLPQQSVRSEVGGGQQKSANPVLQIPRSGFRREAGRLALTSMPADLVQVLLADGPRLLAMSPKNVILKYNTKG
jgi:hypothetical protein